MQPETSIALDRFLLWMTQSRSRQQAGTSEETAEPSASITFCLCLIYYFSLCDCVLKFLPVKTAIILRYLPDAALSLFALALLLKQRRIVSFPLFWPLAAGASTMAISGILNSSSMLAVSKDFWIFFRFAAFTYIGWRTVVTPRRVVQFLRGFLGLAVIELAIGGLELAGGQAAQDFFAPVLGLRSGAAATVAVQDFGEKGWIAGTLSNYNHYGMFMVLACLLSLAMYFIRQSNRYLCLAAACALAVVLSFSRHSLLVLIVALGALLLSRARKMRPGKIIGRSIAAVALLAAFIALAGRLDPAFGERISTIVTPEVLESDPASNVRLYMMIVLPPRFLSAYPFFGQGPIPPSDQVPFGETNTDLGPTLKAAPDLPGIATFYFGDVVWVMILGLYGCCGLAAFGFVFWVIWSAANRVRKQISGAAGAALAQACIAILVAVILSGFFSEEMIARDCIPVFWLLSGLVFSLASNNSSTMRAVATRTPIPLES